MTDSVRKMKEQNNLLPGMKTPGPVEPSRSLEESFVTDHVFRGVVVLITVVRVFNP